jgi:hypothetical protein
MILSNYQQKMYYGQNIPHKVVVIQQITGEEISPVQSRLIPRQSDHHFWAVDQSPRNFRDV